MASSIALRRASSGTSKLLFVNRLRPTSASRFFNTDSHAVDVQRPPDRSVSRRRESSPSFFSDAFDPFSAFSPSRSVSQVLNLMDQFMDSPFASPVPRRAWTAKEDENTLTLKMDMPGLSKEDVKISVQQNTLIIKGEAQDESGGSDDQESSARRYSSRIDLPLNLYKIDEIKAEMKNGVLKVSVPKVKEDEAKNVFQVNVE